MDDVQQRLSGWIVLVNFLLQLGVYEVHVTRRTRQIAEGPRGAIILKYETVDNIHLTA